uniref:Uncharacterized protein n=1 Tax=Leersia perrieri TaxID=77586 RepID=A0A0D9V5M5_9ORYZ
MAFRRELRGTRIDDWERIKRICLNTQLGEKKDRLVRKLTKHGNFTVNSFYNALKMQDTYSNKRKSLERRLQRKNASCQFCHKVETVQNLFLQYPMARFVWEITGKARKTTGGPQTARASNK